MLRRSKETTKGKLMDQTMNGKERLSMTTREPTDRLELILLRDQLDDHQWALSRLMECIGEECRKADPRLATVMLRMAETAVMRVQEENEARRAARNRAENLPPG